MFDVADACFGFCGDALDADDLVVVASAEVAKGVVGGDEDALGFGDGGEDFVGVGVEGGDLGFVVVGVGAVVVGVGWVVVDEGLGDDFDGV